MTNGVVSLLEQISMVIGLIFGPIVILAIIERPYLSHMWWAEALRPLAENHRLARNMLRWRSYWAYGFVGMTLAIGLGWAIAAGIIVGAVMVSTVSPATLASNLIATGWFVFRVQMALVPTCFLITLLVAPE